MTTRSVRLANDRLSEHARGLLTASRVGRHDLALAFEESRATTAEVLVEGRSFYPPMLADIEGASSSVHINQFGFRPGKVGDVFAQALVAKASSGVPVRLVVDEQGSHPFDATRDFYAGLVDGGVQVVVTRATKLRASAGPLGTVSQPRWNLRALGHIDHRKAVVVDGRIGWVGGAGIEDHFEDGRFHDLFVRVEGPVVAQLGVVFVASFRFLGGVIPPEDADSLFPEFEADASAAPAVVLHNAPGRYRPISDAIAEILDGANESLDVVNPYVTDRGMIRRLERAALRGVNVRLVVPAEPNNWACGAAERFHHQRLLDAGVTILEYPTMVHAKAFVRDGEDVLAGTCNLEAWSLKRFYEIDLRVRSRALAQQFAERFFSPAEAISGPGRVPEGFRERAKCAAFAAMSPLL
ncbi:MAG: phospholipase D-like domain-containing protein [Gaiellaceae bacterium]